MDVQAVSDVGLQASIGRCTRLRVLTLRDGCVQVSERQMVAGCIMVV
jgi:hypothetical protein